MKLGYRICIYTGYYFNFHQTAHVLGGRKIAEIVLEKTVAMNY